MMSTVRHDDLFEFVDVFARVLGRIQPGFSDDRALEVAEWGIGAYVRGGGKGLRGIGAVGGVGRAVDDVYEACARLGGGTTGAVEECFGRAIEARSDGDSVQGTGEVGVGAGVCDDSVSRGGTTCQVGGACISSGGVGVGGMGSISGVERLVVAHESKEEEGEGAFGNKTLRNREWRKQKKNRKIRKQRSWRREEPVDIVGKSEAQQTLEAKWVVENKLKAAEAKRKLQLLEMQDVTEVAKLQERKLKAAGERAMVQIEKSHATLAATGNVPGVVPKGGYCTTVLDDPGLSDGSSPTCTISPDSSASMHEYKQCLLDLADTRKELDDAKKLIRRREIMDKATYAQSLAEFTAGSESVMSDGLKCELDRKFGESYEYEGKCDGKHVVRKVFHDGGMNVEDCEFFGDVY